MPGWGNVCAGLVCGSGKHLSTVGESSVYRVNASQLIAALLPQALPQLPYINEESRDPVPVVKQSWWMSTVVFSDGHPEHFWMLVCHLHFFQWNGAQRPLSPLQGKQPYGFWQAQKIPLRWGLWSVSVGYVNLAGMWATEDEIWATAFLSSCLSKPFLGGPRSGVLSSTIQFPEYISVVGGDWFQTKLFALCRGGSPSLALLRRTSFSRQMCPRTPSWQRFQCRIFYSFLYQPELLGPLSY